MPEQFKAPAPGAPAREWGALALSIPGYEHGAGTLQRAPDGPGFARRVETVGIGTHPWHGFHGWGGYDDAPPDPDDPTGATAGCLLTLLGSHVMHMAWTDEGFLICVQTDDGDAVEVVAENVGRACIAAAAVIRCWPGGQP